jgi:hypothetical protein
VAGRIVPLRQHHCFGPEKTAMHPERYHDVTLSKSGVRRVLSRPGMGRLPASRRHDRRGKRYEKRLPGHRVRIGAKLLAPLAAAPRGRRGGRDGHYRFTATDDRTRPRVLRIHPQLDQRAAVQFLDRVLQRLPFQVEAVRTDNGAEFPSAVHRHVLGEGIAHTRIGPRTPRLTGKAGRSHRIAAEESGRLLDGVVIDDAEVFNDKLREGEDCYPYHRPHGGLGGQTPYERLRQKTATQA